ncbi:TetR/AcrR family transcriptional regulator [Arthrobacter sp.]|uniref:TetR/AcrR family transcriptional regulator n=1 Tax=Arthrobacter sp. TaxID=1667 RepID=UPI00289AF66A|nr:TetR/AcrR family transcriptional regulator [Arthrobacter sp.]
MSQQFSLRDRKRAETWAALHAASARRALEDGLECVNVEVVADEAGVSARTFFNYFACKEDAVLGLQEPSVDQAMLDSFDVEGDLLTEVSRLMLAVMRTMEGGEDIDGVRVRIYEAYPHLRQRRYFYILKAEALVYDIVRSRLEESSRWRGRSPGSGWYAHDVEDVARTVVATASTRVRYVMQKTISTPTRTAQFEALEQGLELLRDVFKEVL